MCICRDMGLHRFEAFAGMFAAKLWSSPVSRSGKWSEGIRVVATLKSMQTGSMDNALRL